MNKFSQLTGLAASITTLLKRYSLILFIMVVAGAYGFLVYQISSLTKAEPSAEAVSEKLEAVTRPRIDQKSVDKLRQLEAANVELQTLFDEARNNPFTED